MGSKKGQEKKHQNTIISSGALSGVDLTNRIEKITQEASQKTDFVPKKLLSKSGWWDPKGAIGAFHYQGKYKGKPSVLKVQGVKPIISEVEMIKAFVKQNKSKTIRPPHIYATLPWNEKKGYEAFVIEDIGNKRIISVPSNKSQVQKFFEIYDEYRANCLDKPWLVKPTKNISQQINSHFEKWTKASFRVFPKHPLREPGDQKNIKKAVEVLKKGYQGVELEFVHGHFSHIDLYLVGRQIVILSNLFWSWRTPCYDLIFAYHWFKYDLSGVKGVTPEKIEDQKTLWLDQIQSRTKDKRLLKLALLERAAAGLNLDSLSMDPKRPTASYLVEKTREEVVRLTKELS